MEGGLGFGLSAVLGKEPEYVISPGTYDQKHVVHIGHLQECIPTDPESSTSRTSPTSTSSLMLRSPLRKLLILLMVIILIYFKNTMISMS